MVKSSFINFANKEYIYGFITDIKTERFKQNLNIEILYFISQKKKEPQFILKFRLKALKYWVKMKEPIWAYLDYKKLKYKKICYYSCPKNKEIITHLEPNLIETFDKLGILPNKQNKNFNLAIDIIFDSISLGTTFKNLLAKYGIIFVSISTAINLYPELIQNYLGTVIPIGDNFFTALNSAVFSDGSFCYVPKKIKCPIDLSTYFRINDKKTGQFERTLIIAEDQSELNYLEGCSAPAYSTNQLHAAIVELVALDHSLIKYSTVQNWYTGDIFGRGGIYNFVTKRGLCAGFKSCISWTQIETGSAITWKYPSCILIGNISKGSFYSVALTKNYQQADTGTKMIHIGKETNSHIISKGISIGNSTNNYRGLVKICSSALKSRNYSQCDSLLLSNNSSANTFPYIQVHNTSSQVEHEASISKINEEQIFYFLQRGITIERAISFIMNGFCKDIFRELPLEFAAEANLLLNVKL